MIRIGWTQRTNFRTGVIAAKKALPRSHRLSTGRKPGNAALCFGGRVQNVELQSKMDRSSSSREHAIHLSKLVASAAPLISHNRNSSYACGTGVFINE
jgi:hypothetical protein